MRDIHVSHPSGGEAVQIGCPADLSGVPCRNGGCSGIRLISQSDALTQAGFKEDFFATRRFSLSNH